MFNEDSTWENLEELQLQFPDFDVNSLLIANSNFYLLALLLNLNTRVCI